MLVGNVEGGLSVLDYYSVSSCAVDVPTWGIPVSKKQLQGPGRENTCLYGTLFPGFERKFSAVAVECWMYMCPICAPLIDI